MNKLFASFGFRSPVGATVERKDRLRKPVSLLAAAALIAGAWVVLPEAATAEAVENEKYTQSYTNRNPVGAQNQPETWFVYAKAGETLTVEVGDHKDRGEEWDIHLERAFYTITAPSGDLVQTNETLGGYPESTPDRKLGASMRQPETQPDPIVVPEGGDGIYMIAVRGANRNWTSTSFPWRFTVTDANGAEKTGRTWAETYRMLERWPWSLGPIGTAELKGLDLDYWFVSEQGYEYELELQGFVGWNSVIEASLLGNTTADCTSLYHSLPELNAINTECDDKYNTFFEEPAEDLPADAAIATTHAGQNTPSVGSTRMWVKPGIEEPVVTLAPFVGAGDVDVPKKGTLNYTLSDFAGNYSVMIDADGDGAFDGDLDRKIPRSLTHGGTVDRSYEFDGLDANGDAIPADVTAQVTVLIEHFPELHFVFGDVEQLAGGLSLKRVNGGGDPATDRVYWNDSVPSETPGGEPTLIGEQACGPESGLPSMANDRNPMVNTEGMLNVDEWPGLRYWDTDLANGQDTQDCRDSDDTLTGSYGNRKLLDTWTFADASVTATAELVGPALRVDKTVDAELATPAQPLGYTLTATNNGSVPLTAESGKLAVVKDSLGGAEWAEAVDQESLTATINGAPAGAPTIVDGVLTWQGDLAVGEAVVITYAIEIAADGSAPEAITNRAAALNAADAALPEAADCAAAEATLAYNCAEVTTPVAQGPELLGKSLAVAPGDSVTFDVLGELVTPGDSEELRVELLDPVTGKPVAGTELNVPGGVWTLDAATGKVTFAAGAEFDGKTPPLSVRVTDGNGLSAEAQLTVTFKEPDAPDPVGPELLGKSLAVAPGDSVTFDVLGELVTPGDSEELRVELLDPVTGKPVAGTELNVPGGVWTLDAATGKVTFAAGAEFDGKTPPLSVRVTDGNGLSAEAQLTVTFKEPDAPDPGGPGTETPDPEKPGPEKPAPEKPKPPLSETGGSGMGVLLAIGALLVAAGAGLTARRLRAK